MPAVIIMLLALSRFTEAWATDFEFHPDPDGRPTPVCLVARELHSGREIRLWQDSLRSLPEPPYNIGRDAVFIAYGAQAELSCHLALQWPMPVHVVDMYAEFRWLTNGRPPPCGNGLLGMLAYLGLPSIADVEKQKMRELVLRGGPWSPEEQDQILRYCASDVDALARAMPYMEQHIDLDRALLRGRFLPAVARIEHTGIPLDTETLGRLRSCWPAIKHRLIERVDADYGVFDGTRFVCDRFSEYLERTGIPWPRLLSGRLALDIDTFRERVRAYPQLAPLHELRYTLGQLRLTDLAVGRDGRNRSPLWPFTASTSRNAPSSSSFVFGPATWIRSLIKPSPGRAIGYVDWSQQEFGIAAALAGDPAMIAAYTNSVADPYFQFGKQSGLIPPDGTKTTHRQQRDLCKACVLATGYGTGPDSLADQIGQSPAHARELLRLHRETYPDFWRWSDAAVDHATLTGALHTVFGWRLLVGPDANPRSLRNFPVQGAGAEMMRIAAFLATERGVAVCGVVHDAFVVEAPLHDIEMTVAAMQQAMSDASAIVLRGFRLRSDARIIRYPERYSDPRGERMWSTVMQVLASLAATDQGVHARNDIVVDAHTRSISSISEI